MSNPPERPLAERLLGCWRLLRADGRLDFAPNARMTFLADGYLDYEFDAGMHRHHRVRMVYRVEDRTLHTEVPEIAHRQSANFSFGAGDVLIFDFAGQQAMFVREYQV
ncbi:MAG: hypothetical protein MNPFHGCM_00220 [Gemmatimonadaceae bacterium]|nr:hypothetical protein [Gemmatimonadaceae bacterium]